MMIGPDGQRHTIDGRYKFAAMDGLAYGASSGTVRIGLTGAVTA